MSIAFKYAILQLRESIGESGFHVQPHQDTEANCSLRHYEAGLLIDITFHVDAQLKELWRGRHVKIA